MTQNKSLMIVAAWIATVALAPAATNISTSPPMPPRPAMPGRPSVSLPHAQDRLPQVQSPGGTSSIAGTNVVAVRPASTNRIADAEGNTGMGITNRLGMPVPFDQRTREEDTATTAAIRNDIAAHRGLSDSAKKVTVVTVKGRVTLTGRVGSEEEKQQIGDIASGNGRGGQVVNQLEVHPAAGSASE